jgi:hypothetical protein
MGSGYQAFLDTLGEAHGRCVIELGAFDEKRTRPGGWPCIWCGDGAIRRRRRRLGSLLWGATAPWAGVVMK